MIIGWVEVTLSVVHHVPHHSVLYPTLSQKSITIYQNTCTIFFLIIECKRKLSISYSPASILYKVNITYLYYLPSCKIKCFEDPISLDS